MSDEAVVIGGGPAGLTAAYELAKTGVGSTVLEADTQVGGLSRTVNYNGYRFDIGGHRFFSKVKLINEVWEEILGEAFLLRPRMSRIHYRGHFFDYPLGAMNALAGLGPVESLLVCMSYAKTKILPGREEQSFEQWVVNRFGYRLYNIFFKTYTEKVWGVPCTEISADWAAQRIKNLSLTEAVRNALFSSGKNKDGELITTLIDQFHYPRYGPGMMWERCETLLSEQGNETVRGVKVEKLRHRNGRVECVIGRRDGEPVEFGGSHVISSMPLREMIFALDPPPPPEVLAAADRLRYRDYLTSVLIVDREDVFPDNWIYIHSPEVKMGRIQNYKNWSPHMVPDATKTSLGLEYFLWDSDQEWDWPDEKLVELGIRECSQIGIIDPSEVLDGTVVRMRKAYPVYDQVYHEAVDTIRGYLTTLTNLQTIGRNGQHRYNNQDHSMLTGIYAARNIAGADYDIWSVNVEQEYHEEGKASETSGDRAVPTRVSVPADIEEDTPEALIVRAFAHLDPVALGCSVGLVSAVGLFLATAALLIQGGEVVGPMLSLLGHFLFGFETSWVGAFIGLAEAGLVGFLVGAGGALVRNWGMSAYAHLVKSRADEEESKDLLDRV